MDSAKKEKRKLKFYAKRDFVNHKFHFNFPHKFPRMFCQFLSIYVCIYTQFQPMSLIDLNFSAGKVKTKQNKRKMRIYLIFYLYRDVEAPPRFDTDISLGDVKCVLDRQSSNPCHAPLPTPPHSPSHSNNNKKQENSLPISMGRRRRPSESAIYDCIYSIYLAILYMYVFFDIRKCLQANF